MCDFLLEAFSYVFLSQSVIVTILTVVVDSGRHKATLD
jgi:hypothetical protein